MDKLIEQISVANNNPNLRDEIIADIWNSPIGAAFDSIEEISQAITDGLTPSVMARARKFLGLPVIE